MRKSIEGLLKSLLSQVLKQCPSLVSTTSPTVSKSALNTMDMEGLYQLCSSTEKFSRQRSTYSYINDTLEGYPKIVERKDEDLGGHEQLAKYLRNEANGEFLLVFLVIRHILRGMENSDGMSAFREKLRTVPTELNALFRHILDSVDEYYHKQQAQMLFVAYQANKPLKLTCYSFQDKKIGIMRLTALKKPMPRSEVTRRSHAKLTDTPDESLVPVNGLIYHLIKHFLFQAQEIERSGATPLITQLEQPQETIEQHYDSSNWWQQKVGTGRNKTVTFLHLVIRHEHSEYLEWYLNLDRNKSLAETDMANLLDYALRPQIYGNRNLNVDIVTVLLNRNANPIMEAATAHHGAFPPIVETVS
ncbi:hypothetical protein K469DRAFT_762415 [Zopfia rhizophila CBS 207.26]|uniref:Uncharacterized protein n=1 Tax=Zopfia rhizophila CBS 207.26 TaxID=1314779 RepID=A0A6A6EFG5_9PEZI|nr:hypothetical protein K469DRAFT_762415 [Zopfia rhizophila CBS 207.26]